MKYLVFIRYDGTKFHGFQRQKKEKSVQKVLEDSLSELLEEPIVIKGAGRTDAGVHALNQAFHFETKIKLPANFKRAWNQKLKGEVIVNKIIPKDDCFHARFNAKEKHYVYKINLGKYQEKYEGYIFQPKKGIDVKKIKEIKNLFIGTHDFHNFVSGQRQNYETTITKIKVRKKGSILEIHFWGHAFYRYMIRNLVGAFIYYSRGKITKAKIAEMLNMPDSNKHLPTVPSDGLYLIKVYY